MGPQTLISLDLCLSTPSIDKIFEKTNIPILKKIRIPIYRKMLGFTCTVFDVCSYEQLLFFLIYFGFCIFMICITIFGLVAIAISLGEHAPLVFWVLFFYSCFYFGYPDNTFSRAVNTFVFSASALVFATISLVCAYMFERKIEGVRTEIFGIRILSRIAFTAYGILCVAAISGILQSALFQASLVDYKLDPAIAQFRAQRSAPEIERLEKAISYCKKATNFRDGYEPSSVTFVKDVDRLRHASYKPAPNKPSLNGVVGLHYVFQRIGEQALWRYYIQFGSGDQRCLIEIRYSDRTMMKPTGGPIEIPTDFLTSKLVEQINSDTELLISKQSKPDSLLVFAAVSTANQLGLANYNVEPLGFFGRLLQFITHWTLLLLPAIVAGDMLRVSANKQTD